jgi:hypothetical protein
MSNTADVTRGKLIPYNVYIIELSAFSSQNLPRYCKYLAIKRKNSAFSLCGTVSQSGQCLARTAH